MEKILKPGLLALKALMILIGLFLIYKTVATWGEDWDLVKNTDNFFKSDVYAGFMGYLSGTVAYTRVLLFLAIIIILVAGGYKMVTNPKKSLVFLGGIAAVLIIAGIGYAMAGDSVDPNWETKAEVTAEVSKRVGMGIKMVAILLGLAVVGIVYGEVSKLFK